MPKRRSAPTADAPAFVPPYAPSWVDRLTRWVDGFPGPSWVYYLGLFGAIALLLAVAHWWAGSYRPWTFEGLHVILPAGLGALFILMSFFNRTGARALQDFRPALAATGNEYEEFRYRLTTLPAWPTIWAGAGFVLFILGAAWIDARSRLVPTSPPMPAPANLLAGLLPAFRLSPQPAPAALGVLVILSSWLAMGALAYQILRQLRIISDIYSHHSIVDLFYLSPLYAFSRHTARIAITLLVLTILLGAIIPDLARQRGSLIIEGSFVAVAGGAFLWPLLGVHRLLAKERERMLAENGQMMRATVADLHRNLGAGKLAQMARFHEALASLEIERAALVRVPTWPWEPATLRGVVAALLLPIVIWLIQYGLGRVMP